MARNTIGEVLAFLDDVRPKYAKIVRDALEQAGAQAPAPDPDDESPRTAKKAKKTSWRS